jgi:uncharacterized glyoxalase superfamily protein PhnB
VASNPPPGYPIVVDDVDALHARVAEAGVEAGEMETSPAGDRRFTIADPEGQIWVFAQRLR